MAQRHVRAVRECQCVWMCTPVCEAPRGDKYSLCTCVMDDVSVLAISSVLQAVSGRLSELNP